MKRIIFLLFLCLSTLVLAQPKEPTNFDDIFKAGIQNYHDKKFEEAKKNFEQAIAIEPKNVSALTNLGLTAYSMGQKGLAIGLWRKALYYDTSSQAASLALDYALEKYQIKDIPHKILYWETFRKQFLVGVNINAYQSITVILFFLGSWLLISFVGKRRRAIGKDEVPPGFPVVGTIFSLLFIGFACLTVLKIIDEQNARGTITIEKIAVLAGPKESEPSLFDLFEGHEVIIERVENDWVQVTYPGALSGWIPKSAIIQNFGHDTIIN